MTCLALCWTIATLLAGERPFLLLLFWVLVFFFSFVVFLKKSFRLFSTDHVSAVTFAQAMLLLRCTSGGVHVPCIYSHDR